MSKVIFKDNLNDNYHDGNFAFSFFLDLFCLLIIYSVMLESSKNSRSPPQHYSAPS